MGWYRTPPHQLGVRDAQPHHLSTDGIPSPGYVRLESFGPLLGVSQRHSLRYTGKPCVDIRKQGVITLQFVQYSLYFFVYACLWVVGRVAQRPSSSRCNASTFLCAAASCRCFFSTSSFAGSPWITRSAARRSAYSCGCMLM